VTHGGGKARPANEYRIQITGIANLAGAQQFKTKKDTKTLVLGWWDDIGVFCGFDVSHHLGPLGKSPSLQIGKDALETAHRSGFSIHNKGNGELALAFQPEFVCTYIKNLETLHDCGTSPSDLKVLSAIENDPEQVSEAEISRKASKARRYAIMTSTRALRDMNFRARVMTAYGRKCAICGIQLQLLDAAHILPVVHPDSDDETSNGIALCALHHRAYDKGLITFDADYKTHINSDEVARLREKNLDAGFDDFRKRIRPLIILPPDRKDRPAPKHVDRANEVRGWAL
jgi:putative restriction endonuclease